KFGEEGIDATLLQGFGQRSGYNKILRWQSNVFVDCFGIDTAGANVRGITKKRRCHCNIVGGSFVALFRRTAPSGDERHVGTAIEALAVRVFEGLFHFGRALFRDVVSAPNGSKIAGGVELKQLRLERVRRVVGSELIAKR